MTLDRVILQPVTIDRVILQAITIDLVMLQAVTIDRVILQVVTINRVLLQVVTPDGVILQAVTITSVIVLAVTGQLLTTVALVLSSVAHLVFVVDIVALGRVFPRELPLYPVSCHSVSAAHSSINRMMDCGPVKGHRVVVSPYHT